MMLETSFSSMRNFIITEVEEVSELGGRFWSLQTPTHLQMMNDEQIQSRKKST